MSHKVSDLSPQDAYLSIPRTRAIAAFLEDWSVLGYCREGYDHTDRKLPCQDSISYGITDGVLWVGVADGLGSAQFSHLGSDLAVRSVSDAISRTPNEHLFTKAGGLSVFADIATTLRQLASEKQIPEHMFATTLQVVLIDLETLQFAYHVIGDGHTIFRSEQGASEILGSGRPQTTYGTPHILMDESTSYFHCETGNLTKDSLLLIFTDGLDPMFTNRATEPDAQRSPSQDNIAAFFNLFSEKYNENKAIFAASQTIDSENHVENMRDDVSFIALKWNSEKKIDANTPESLESQLPNSTEQAAIEQYSTIQNSAEETDKKKDKKDGDDRSGKLAIDEKLAAPLRKEKHAGLSFEMRLTVALFGIVIVAIIALIIVIHLRLI